MTNKIDPPLIDIKVTNPLTYLKNWITKLLKDEGIDFRLKIRPLTAVAMVFAMGLVSGTSFSIAQFISPYLPPIMRQEITYQGLIQKTLSGQYYLTLPDNSIWILKPVNSSINFDKMLNTPVVLKGNLTKDRNVIEVVGVKTFQET